MSLTQRWIGKHTSGRQLKVANFRLGIESEHAHKAMAISLVEASLMCLVNVHIN